MTTTTHTPVPHAPSPHAPQRVAGGLLDPRMLLTSLPDALRKLDPRTMLRNPVMFVVEVGAVFSTVSAVTNASVFAWTVVVWLWLTVIFANLAEAVAEGRGKAQADTLRRAKTETTAHRLVGAGAHRGGAGRRSSASGTGWSSSPARSSPATATSSRASPASTSRPSPASRHP